MRARPFDECYTIEPNSGCWLWTECIQHGYGLKQFRGRLQKAHRVSWILNVGEIPKGLQVNHKPKCHERSCVNPDHLYIGTQKDNIRDRDQAGNSPLGSTQKGEDNLYSKLTDADVFSIRADTRPQSKTARDFGVSQGLISMIKTRRIWNHI